MRTNRSARAASFAATTVVGVVGGVGGTVGGSGEALSVVGVEDEAAGGLEVEVGAPVVRAFTDDGEVEVEIGRVVGAVAAFEELELHPHAATATTQTNAKLARI